MKQGNKQPLSLILGETRAARGVAVGALMTLILWAVLIAVNACLGMLPQSIVKPDVTGSETFKLSGVTRDWLKKQLDEDVTLYLFCEGGSASADGEIYSFLQRYAETTDRVRVEVVDPSTATELMNRFGLETVENLSVVVESAIRYRVIENSELYYYSYGDSSGNTMTMTPEQYYEMVDYLNANDTTGQTASLFISSVKAYFDGDARVTNAINYVTRGDVAVAYVLTGNGASVLDAALSRTLSQSCYDLRTILTLERVPKDCALLVINAPSIDLSADEAKVLSEYLADGGRLFLTTAQSVGALPNLNGVLSAYGMSFESSMKVVCEGNPNNYFESYYGAVTNVFRSQIQSQHAVTGSFDETFVVCNAHAITLSEVAGVTVTPWLYTTQAGYLNVGENAMAQKAEYTVGAIAERGETKIVWIATPYALTESYNAYANGGNFTLGISAFNWMTGVDSDGIAIASKQMKTGSLSVTYTQFILWAILLVVILPAAAVVGGVIIRYVRRKR